MKKQHTGNRALRNRKTVTIIVAVLAAAISGIYFTLMLRRVANMHIIFYMVLGVSVLLVTYLILWTLSANEKRARLAGILKRCYLICLVVGIAGFLTFQGLIISGAHTDETEADCLIILGAGLRNNSPSLMLRSRLNAAVEYLKTREDIPVIVSGGLGRGETITEAEAMSRYLISRGIDEARIWKEDKSTSTRENLAFSMALMEREGLDAENTRVAIVTNEFHLYRARLIATKAGLDAAGVAAATPGPYLRTINFFREAFALAAEVLLRR